MTAKTVSRHVKKTAKETAGVLTDVAKSIGSALGAVAVKAGIAHEPTRRRHRRVPRVKSVRARAKVSRSTRAKSKRR
jgi:hypothetical protein